MVAVTEVNKDLMRWATSINELQPGERVLVIIEDDLVLNKYERRRRIGRRSVDRRPYCPKFNVGFKDRVRTFWGNQCAMCGAHQDELPTKLSVHHVTYNKSACCSIDDDTALMKLCGIPEKHRHMFIPLCPMCHAKTNFVRDYWKMRFVLMIMDLYGGKSYYNPGDNEW